ncbi:MAG: SMP-30/gluconolactonase/LRE family protein [Chloroflexi bacterium]|jgi:gluconolactonase|nr:SMP-30/gluconolactonase/LRE family protein [Chloroflexota bacterium]MBT5252824.1 SMP-30/gluconolactonase/LRE family protein [Chloroflexota bacterium]MBT5893091.1 SMP-30/gluconolactonase/LRE family protein [Chloroflexota bacterium]MBT6708298.1 SMP-30/gluconolactonase/LRE family protein [Chloroflexota bacterium]
MEQFEVFDDEFQRILGSNPELIQRAGGLAFAEGVCWVPRLNKVIASDIPNNRIVSWGKSEGFGIYREPSGCSNGNTVDREGRIISCLTRGRAVVREELDGTMTTIANSFKGGKLTSPNDVSVKSDGSIWFTDPDYGFLHLELGHGEKPEQDRNRVFRVDGDTLDISMVSEDFDKPNGITFSPDESVLYIGDTGRTHGDFRPHNLMAFDVAGDKLANPRLFADVEPHVPDGFRADVNGNIWVAAGDGVQVFNPAGNLLGKIHTPEISANLSFGMPDGQTLFIGATSSIWSIELNIAGATRPIN